MFLSALKQIPAVLAFAAFAWAPTTSAQTFPTKPLTLIVPLPPGGASDAQARALAAAASKDLGQPIIVMNRPGVVGTYGPALMAQQSAADGYTVSMIPASLFRLPHLQKVNYDPLKDFTYVIAFTEYVFGVTVAANSPWKNIKELMAHAKANPGKITYGATGKGSSGNIAMERLAKGAGVDWKLAPFKGVAEQFISLIGNHIDVVGDAGFGDMVDAGRGRLLLTFTESRLQKYPDVPTAKELGYDVVVKSPLGIAGPKDMDPKIVKILHDAFMKATNDPTFKRTLEIQGQPQIYMSSKDYTRYAAEQFAEDKRFISELNMKLE